LRDQNQTCADDDDPDGSRNALTGRCKAFYGDGHCYERHHAKVHDPEDKQDCHQAGRAVAAAQAEAQAMAPGRARVRRQPAARPRRLATEG
jgi:hypothetical protein